MPLVKPTYVEGWDPAGGIAESDESPLDAVKREIREELGLVGTSFGVLCVDWMAPHDPWDSISLRLRWRNAQRKAAHLPTSPRRQSFRVRSLRDQRCSDSPATLHPSPGGAGSSRFVGTCTMLFGERLSCGARRRRQRRAASGPGPRAAATIRCPY
ncbi:NUDIX hydrolase [Streptomyces sp. NPDC020096]